MPRKLTHKEKYYNQEAKLMQENQIKTSEIDLSNRINHISQTQMYEIPRITERVEKFLSIMMKRPLDRRQKLGKAGLSAVNQSKYVKQLLSNWNELRLMGIIAESESIGLTDELKVNKLKKIVDGERDEYTTIRAIEAHNRMITAPDKSSNQTQVTAQNIIMIPNMIKDHKQWESQAEQIAQNETPVKLQTIEGERIEIIQETKTGDTPEPQAD